MRALEVRAADADLLVLLATSHLVLGDETAAGQFLDRAYALDPENEKVLALPEDVRRAGNAGGRDARPG